MMKSLFSFLSNVFTNWLFTPAGVTTVSLVWGGLIAALGAGTQYIQNFSPVSYAILFPVGILITICPLILIKKLFDQKVYKTPTWIEFDFDGNTIHAGSRINIWGWRWAPWAIAQPSTPAIFWISACFDKPVSADTIKISCSVGASTIFIAFGLINFESRYANIQLPLKEIGKYKIEYKYHGQS